jgi:Cu2+-exporting ATPase
MKEQLDLSMFVTRAGGVSHLDLAVEGVGCASCIRKIESGLKRIPGIVDARLNFTNRRLAVDWCDGTLTPSDVIRALEQIGYHAHPFTADHAESDETRHARRLLKCLAVAGFAAMNIMLLSVSVWSGNASDMTQETRDFFHWLSAVIALPAAAYAGQPFFQNALAALRTRQLNMDVPISLGVLLALGISVIETAGHAEHAYFDSAVMLLFFLLCGRYLDQAMRRKTRAVAGNLAALKAEVAHRFEHCGELVTVPVAALKPGDRLLVRPGERVPADGTVLSGSSEIDASLITGETARKKLSPGATIYAGSINYSGALTMRVSAAGAGTLLDEVERLLERAVTARSRRRRLIDRAARLYAPMVHATAALTLLGWLVAGASLHASIITAIAVLIITCPCALALAIPAVQVVASGALFRAGVILNAGDAIERLAEIDTIVFDKTGTLTLPEPRVADRSKIASDLLEMAARLALSSRHPLATALAREACDRTPFEGAVEEPGQGVRCVIDGREARLGGLGFCGVRPGVQEDPDVEAGTSFIAFTYSGRSAIFAIRQTLRPDAAAVVKWLTARGLALYILSGDRPEAVRPVAASLGILQWQAELDPAQKIATVEALKAAGRGVLMVGDGLNDAPSLAAAHVSLSPIAAAHITQAQADAVFLGESLAPVRDAVAIAHRAGAVMRQNLWLAAAYNAIAVPIAILGYVTPLLAALAMSGSSLLVTLNALRARDSSAFRERRSLSWMQGEEANLPAPAAPHELQPRRPHSGALQS